MNKKTSRHLGWLFTFLILLNLLLSLGMGLYVRFTGNVPSMTFNMIMSQMAILLPGIFFLIKESISLKEILPFRRIHFTTFLKIFLLTLAISPVHMLVNFISQLFVPNTMAEVSDTLFDTGVYVPLLMMILLGPLFEEFMFRGIFMNGYKKVSRPIVAVLFSSLLFGLMHLNLNQMSYAIVIGIFMALANEATGSILPSCIMHMLINFTGSMTIYLTSLTSQLTGESLAESAEVVRNSDMLMQVIPVYAILAFFGLLFSILLLKSMAEKEGRAPLFKGLFRKTGEGHAFSLALIIGILLALGMIFFWGVISSTLSSMQAGVVVFGEFA